MRSVDDDFSPEAEEQVRALLAAQPRPAMPPELRHRILTALAAEPQPDFAPTRNRSRAWWGVAAVAAAIVLLAGAILIPRSAQHPATTVVGEEAPAISTDDVPGVAAQASWCGGQPLTYQSGTRYQAASFGDQAEDLAAACALATPSPTAVPQPTASAIPAMSPGLALRSVRCVINVAPPTADVLVVDQGFYGTDPATIAVVGPPSRALVLDCRDQPVRVLADVKLD